MPRRERPCCGCLVGPDQPTPKRVDSDYTIRPCEPDPKEKHDPGATDIGLTVGS